MPQHGYASNTPATDGGGLRLPGHRRVHAFDLKGKEQWKQKVGTDRSVGIGHLRRLYNNLVIVNAAIECSRRALQKRMARRYGDFRWHCSGARRLVETDAGKQELSSAAKVGFGAIRSSGELWH